MRSKVLSSAKSTYRGQYGAIVGFSNGRSEWLISNKYAKAVCLVFDHGFMAGKRMWFSINEIE